MFILPLLPESFFFLFMLALFISQIFIEFIIKPIGPGVSLWKDFDCEFS
jgi:hypothetical protein